MVPINLRLPAAISNGVVWSYYYRYHPKGQHKLKNEATDTVLGRTAGSHCKAIIIGRELPKQFLLPIVNDRLSWAASTDSVPILQTSHQSIIRYRRLLHRCMNFDSTWAVDVVSCTEYGDLWLTVVCQAFTDALVRSKSKTTDGSAHGNMAVI